MGYGDFKNLPKKADAEKFLRDKSFFISKNQNYVGHQCELP